jgi:CRISPR/Cas system Type II protein with McrA/HNH and RuvC-like nuclease domain
LTYFLSKKHSNIHIDPTRDGFSFNDFNNEYGLLKSLYIEIYSKICSVDRISKREDEVKNALKTALRNMFTSEYLIDKLTSLDFSNTDRGSYSLKSIEKLLPFMNGEKGHLNEYDSKNEAYPHLNVKDKIEHIISGNIPLFSNNDVRNPLVMKVVNIAIKRVNNTVSEIIEADPDATFTFKIELGRELCLNKEKRLNITKRNKANEDRNSFCKNLYNLVQNDVTSCRGYMNGIKIINLFLEQIVDKKSIEKLDDITISKIISGEIKALNIYTGDKIRIHDALNTSLYEIEHTMNRAAYNSDSMLNLTLCDKITNGKKADNFAFGRARKPEEEFGVFRRIAIAKAKPSDIQKGSQDGGATTALLAAALQNGLIDGAVVSINSKEKPFLPIPILAITLQQIVEGAGTK